MSKIDQLLLVKRRMKLPVEIQLQRFETRFKSFDPRQDLSKPDVFTAARQRVQTQEIINPIDKIKNYSGKSFFTTPYSLKSMAKETEPVKAPLNSFDPTQSLLNGDAFTAARQRKQIKQKLNRIDQIRNQAQASFFATANGLRKTDKHIGLLRHQQKQSASSLEVLHQLDPENLDINALQQSHNMLDQDISRYTNKSRALRLKLTFLKKWYNLNP